MIIKPPLAVFSDFDGTISSCDTWVFLLEKFGPPEWTEIEKQMLRGELTEKEGFAMEIASLRTSWDIALKTTLKSITIDRYFSDFVNVLAEAEIPFKVVSGGILPMIEALLKKAGIANVEIRANDVEVNGDKWRLIPAKSPSIKGLCNHCKTHWLREKKEQGYQIVYIGDGHTDRCPAECADIVFAKAELAKYCRKNGMEFQPFDSFRNIISFLNKADI